MHLFDAMGKHWMGKKPTDSPLVERVGAKSSGRHCIPPAPRIQDDRCNPLAPRIQDDICKSPAPRIQDDMCITPAPRITILFG